MEGAKERGEGDAQGCSGRRSGVWKSERRVEKRRIKRIWGNEKEDEIFSRMIGEGEGKGNINVLLPCIYSFSYLPLLLCVFLRRSIKTWPIGLFSIFHKLPPSTLLSPPPSPLLFSLSSSTSSPSSFLTPAIPISIVIRLQFQALEIAKCNCTFKFSSAFSLHGRIGRK